MEEEGIEQEIILQSEYAVVGAVYSVNGYTGHVVLKTSDLENDSDYQTSSDVAGAISTHNADEEAHPYIQGQFAGKQDKLTAGANVQISEQNVISATDTTYTQGNGINISGQNAISVDTTVVATQQNLSDEVTNRENADIYLQGQIDAISASSDVVDIVGTYADLQNYDTQHLKDNDIIKVLQDETQGNATTYYRWSTHTQTFTLIGQEGPYYTKAGADAQFVPQTRTVNSKALSSNITLTASDVSAVGTSDVVQTTGTSTAQIMSQKATTDALATKLNITDYVVDDHLANTTNPVQNQVLNGLIGSMPSDFFTGEASTSGTGTDVTLASTIQAPILMDEILGDTSQQTYSGANLIDYTNTSTVSDGITVDGNGWITVTYDNSASTSTVYRSYYILLPLLSSDTNYNIILEVKSISGTFNSVYAVSTGSGTGFTQGYRLLSSDITAGGVYSDIRTTISGLTSAHATRTMVQYGAGQSGSITFRLSIIADTSVTPQTFIYQPYTGGIPAPNPDYPQTVNVVTGEQTVLVHGKNLWGNISSYSRSTNGIDFVTNADGTITASGTATASAYSVLASGAVDAGVYLTLQAGTYTLSEKNGNEVQAVVAESGGAIIADTSTSEVTFTLTQTTNVAIRAVIPSGTAITGTLTFYPMLETGSSPTSYEPYQSQSYAIDLTRNLWSPTPYKANYYISQYGVETASDGVDIYQLESVEEGTSYTLSGTATVTSTIRIHAYTSAGVWMEQIDTISAVADQKFEKTVTIPTGAGILRWSSRPVNNALLFDTANPPIELCKIGIYQDYIYKSGDDFYVHKETNKTLLNGTEDWSVSYTGTANWFYKYNTNIGFIESAMPVSSHYIGTSITSSNTNKGVYVISSGYIRIREETEDTVPNFQTWLSNNNVSVYAVLATPTNTKIVDIGLVAELKALWEANSYADNTYLTVTATGTNLPATLSVGAYKKTLNGMLGAIGSL